MPPGLKCGWQVTGKVDPMKKLGLVAALVLTAGLGGCVSPYYYGAYDDGYGNYAGGYGGAYAGAGDRYGYNDRYAYDNRGYARGYGSYYYPPQYNPYYGNG